MVNKSSEFYNRSMKSWLQENDIKVYSAHSVENYVVAKIFIRTLENEIYKYVTLISKNVYIDNLDDIIDKCNNTCHRAIQKMPIDVKFSTYIDFEV